MTPADSARFQLELEFASILGMDYLGTGSDPTNSSQKELWDVAGEKWEALNGLSRAWGIRMYPHNHADAYSFLQDGPMVEVTADLVTGAPLPAPQMVRTSSGIRRMEYFLQITDRSSCYIELDVPTGLEAEPGQPGRATRLSAATPVAANLGGHPGPRCRR